MIKLTAVQSKYDLLGKPPGYLNEDREATPIRLEMLSFGAGEKTERVNTISLEDALARQSADRNSWLIFHGIPSLEQLERIGKEFDLDSLILEDIQNCAIMRPGFQITDNYFFAVLKFPFMHGEEEFKMTPLCFVASGKTIITFQTSEDLSLEPLIDRVENCKGRICSKEIDYLAFCHLDLAVDYYFMFINQLSENMEKIEGKIIASPTPDMLTELQKLKRIAASMRKSIWPLREMIHLINISDSSFISESNEKYYLGLDSHMLLIFDNAESVREMISGLLEIYLSSISNRMNEVMKVLTLIATIFIPLTFIAGVYGMNFKNLPETQWHYGYFMALGLMLAIALAMLKFFRNKKWL